MDLVGSRIEIGRSMIDRIVGNCKTETSQKPVVMDEHIAQALSLGDRRAVHGTVGLGLDFAASQRETAFLAFKNHAVLHSTCRKTGWYSQECRLAHVSTLIFDSHQVVGCESESCAGVPATRIVQGDDDGYTQALEQAKRPSARTTCGSDHEHGNSWSRMICCGMLREELSGHR